MDIKLIALNLVLVLSFLLIICIIVFMYLNIFYFVYLKVPTLSVGNKVIKKILQSIDFGGKDKFYDLGSGNGKLISLVANQYPKMECIGIEYNACAYFCSKLRNIFSKNKVSYQRKNFFKANLGDADIVYVYLFPSVMSDLEVKFSNELKKGALVIANSFPLKYKKPRTIIRGEVGSLNTLYIYEY